MRICPALLCCLASLLFAARFCQGDEDRVEVVGIGECADCERNNINAEQAFSGIRVSINCLTPEGVYQRRGVGELNEEGKFKVLLPSGILATGKSKEECYAQLHNAAAAPCPSYGGPKSSKIVFKAITHGKHTYGLADKLMFSPVTCTSAFLWPYFKHPLPKFKPPVKGFGHPWFPPKKLQPLPAKDFPPIYKKPLPPLEPVYKKPFPPQIPIHKEPLPMPIPTYKKPLPQPIPVYKKPFLPFVPKFEKPLPPPIPIFKKPIPQPFPIFKKPLPPPFPFFKPLPPFYKKPFPEIPPEQPTFGELPPFVQYP
ncbi:proline-rich protein 4-like isoform X1 [Rhodamnia argentea]|uniref:Proline-rich protein 4-like isoform X1 n=1 Tax=Rhodamnia argentea TaxID=178133 RepID=A0A8B8NLG7_9MYRT|nr:proline-rich protein 4-like isoform X1 [Rhodamnia argentea]